MVPITTQQYDVVQPAHEKSMRSREKKNKKIKEGVDPDLLRDESACAQHDICDSSISITHYVKLIYELNRAARVDPNIQKELCYLIKLYLQISTHKWLVKFLNMVSECYQLGKLNNSCDCHKC